MSKLVFSLLPMKITYLFDSRFCNLFLCFMFSDQLRYVIKKVQKLELYYDPINAIKVIPSLMYLVALLSNNQSCFCNVRVDRIDEIVYTHISDWKNKIGASDVTSNIFLEHENRKEDFYFNPETPIHLNWIHV